jgi:polyisoprenoid-binding protein YceI
VKKLAVFLIASIGFLAKTQGQIFVADSCSVSFFSATSIEDIAAVNTICKPIMSTDNGEIDISIPNIDFQFKKKLMEEHFNEDYMESDKYPNTVFRGNVNEKIDYTKDGANNVTVTGKMNMHGVIKTITIPGTLTIKGGIIYLTAKFDLKMADYNIKVPSVLGSNVAEQVAITFRATMKPYKAK